MIMKKTSFLWFLVWGSTMLSPMTMVVLPGLFLPGCSSLDTGDLAEASKGKPRGLRHRPVKGMGLDRGTTTTINNNPWRELINVRSSDDEQGCVSDSDCHANAYCATGVAGDICQCKRGYYGDGLNECLDIGNY